MDEIVQFDFPTDSPKIIKVIGVGGGGGNAVSRPEQTSPQNRPHDPAPTTARFRQGFQKASGF